jgi:antibiotic biosynthesis monooxygenase (ABM) superfamily enzyme
VEGPDSVRKDSGMEFWFSLPELPAAHPSPHKMALVLFVVVYTLIVLINITLGPLMVDWPYLARVFLAVFLQVTLMTYLVMPRVTRLLKPWLYG